MDFLKEKVGTMCTKLSGWIVEGQEFLDGSFLMCDYKTDNTLPKDDEAWQALEKNHRFWGRDKHFWLHYSFKTPKAKEDRKYRFRLETDTGVSTWDATNPQGIIYIDGKNVQALDINHRYMDCLENDKEYDMYIYMYTGMFDSNKNDRDFTVSGYLEIINIPAETLYYDLLVPYEALDCLEKDSYDYTSVLNALDEATMLMDLRELYSDSFNNSLKAASKFMKEEFYEKQCGKNTSEITCVGHTHIDVAWLWTVAQTREKAQRSFATALRLMDLYPDYVFMSSQPQLYEHVKEEDPELYERIKQRIKEGRWEIEGAMWLEADSNLTSGESLVRQLLFGKRFIRKEFGVESRMLWLPDVFGYSGALPQILKKAGVDRFYTSKLKWNEKNKIPHDTFVWEGIDGTQIMAASVNGYVDKLDTNLLYTRYRQYQDKRLTDNTLVTFGYGDGGGGTTIEMMEKYERLKYGLPGFAKAKAEKATDWFNKLESNFKKNTKKLKYEPRWVGELYLEFHRGTYTSIAKNKKKNRKSELLYQSAECSSVFDMLLNATPYPTDIFFKNQKNILLNQFHDIIPGSSIKDVYDVTDKDYERIMSDGTKIFDTSLKNIAKTIKTDGGIFVYNPAPFEISETIDVNGKKVMAENIPAHGWRVIENKPYKTTVSVGDKYIENNLIKVTFDDKCQIISIYDKQAQREVVAKDGVCNQLAVYEDYPYKYDAWEICEYYSQKKWIIDDLQNAQKIDGGFKITRKYGLSAIEQKITLKEDSKRIDFDTWVDWHEDHVLLRTAFPVDIHSQYATYEIQFGNVQRPTHRNTSWEEAKYEVCAHKWADLSESGYGVSLLNDCKYGHSTERNVISMSLLKSATHPNPEADREEHTFVYSLYPHEGDWREAGTVKEAYMLNMPLKHFEIEKQDGKMPEAHSIVECDKENVVVETVKKAEDGNEIIVRMYEAYDKKSKATLSFGFDVKEAYICNLLEEDDVPVEVKNNKIELDIRNFEIVTLKLKA